MNILFIDEKNIIDKEIESLLLKASKVILEREGIFKEGLEISITLVDADEIKELNRDFRGIDKITDVLSFPQYESIEDLKKEYGELIPLGDVVICHEKVIKQAEELGHSPERELIYLFVHSVLHLLGYDHEKEEDRINMREREKSIMHELNILR